MIDGAGIDHGEVFAAMPTAYLVLTPQFVVCDANRAYLRVAGRRREDVVGRDLFEAFPPDPDGPDADGPRNLRASLLRTLATGTADTMPLQRWDIEVDGRYERRFWSPINTPVLDAEGEPVLLLHRVEDVTGFVDEREAATVGIPEADVLARSREAQELALRLTQQRRLLQDVVDRIDVGILLTRGEDHRIVLANDAGRRMLPTTRPPLGITIAELYADNPPTAELAASVYDGVLGTGTAQRINDLAVPALPGEGFEGHRYYDVTFSRLGQGDERGVLAVYHETTDAVRRRVRLERELADEQDVAVSLQAALLPGRLPDVPGLALSALLRPAGRRSVVGGDFYDVVTLPDERLLLVLGDVCGKGVPAARIAGLVRNALRGVATVQSDVADLLASVNRALLRAGFADTPVNLCTLALVAVTARPGEARADVALAGHPPPVLLGATARYVGTPGPILGVISDPVYPVEPIRVSRGETLLLYSDGLPDAHAPSRMLEPRDVATAAAATADGPDALVAGVRDAVVSGVGEPRDDLALLALAPR